jgi:NhaP-type Na+/H+ or K+/H+ antiporter
MEPFCDDSDLRSGIPDLASDCCVGHRGADEVSANSIYGRSGSWWIVPELASFAVAVSAATNQRPNWLTPDVILILFLPALVFEGSLKIDVRELLRDAAPLLVLANVGILLATVVTGI